MREEIIIPGPAGDIEAALYRPSGFKYLAVICHPHPLYEGTMYNKVVTSVAKVFEELNIASLTFNFRGVGNSAGKYSSTVGETKDCIAVANWFREHYPNYDLILAGFSFGSFIAANAAQSLSPVSLISIAPPVEKFAFSRIRNVKCPWLIIQGREDEISKLEHTKNWYEKMPNNNMKLLEISAGHFFHKKLIELQKIIRLNHEWLKISIH